MLFGYIILGFTGGSAGKESVCNAGDLGLIPGLGRSPGEGNGNPLQCSGLENPKDRGAWWASIYGVAKSQTQLSLSQTEQIEAPGLPGIRDFLQEP